MPHEPYQTSSGSMEVERRRLGEAGCSVPVIETLLEARAATTNKTNSKVWEKFATFAEIRRFDSLAPPEAI